MSAAATTHPRQGTKSDRARQIVRATLLWLAGGGVAAVVLVSQQIESQVIQAACPALHPTALTCLGGHPPSSLTLELAGNRVRMACQLHPVEQKAGAAQPTLAERVCIERRIQTHWDELTQLDARLFMPLYGLFSILLAAWIALQPQRQTSTQETSTQGWLARSQVLVALAIVVVTAVLLALDREENVRAMAVLVEAERGLFMSERSATLETLAGQAREAGLMKWVACALWAAALAVGLALRRLDSPGRCQQWARRISIALFGVSAAALAGSAGYAWMSHGFGEIVRGLHFGFSAALFAACAAVLLVWVTPERS